VRKSLLANYNIFLKKHNKNKHIANHNKLRVVSKVPKLYPELVPEFCWWYCVSSYYIKEKKKIIYIRTQELGIFKFLLKTFYFLLKERSFYLPLIQNENS